MRTPGRLRLIPLAALLTLALVPATSAVAATARPAANYITTAYLWSGLGYYLYNSAGEGITVTPTATGQYDVYVEGLAPVAGKAIVEVTPYGSSNDTCSVQYWDASSISLLAHVDCYTAVGGVPANTAFDLLVTHPSTTPHGVFDYAWNYMATGSGTLHGYQYNSSRDANKVQHLGTGRYQITFVGPKSSGMRGTVKVSPYGAGAGDCGPVSWHGTTHGEVILVNCYAPAGALQNREFSVTYASANNLLGQSGIAGANALANHPTTTQLRPGGPVQQRVACGCQREASPHGPLPSDIQGLRGNRGQRRRHPGQLRRQRRRPVQLRRLVAAEESDR